MMAADAPTKDARWRAIIVYRTDNGPLDVECWLAEAADLHDRLELGPHWDTVISVTMTRVNHNEDAAMTVEGAREL